MIILLITFISQCLEYTLGFGGTLVALVLGGFFFDINDLLFLIIPINMLLNLSVIIKDKSFIQLDLLTKKILPVMGVGFIFSVLISSNIAHALQIIVIGGTIIISSIRALLTLNIKNSPKVILNSHFEKITNNFYFFMGGFAQALIGAGGPFVTFRVVTMSETHKSARASLALLWFILNTIVLTGLFFKHHPGKVVSLQSFIAMVIVFPLAMLSGEMIAKKIKQNHLSTYINVMLLCSGVLLIINNLPIFN